MSDFVFTQRSYNNWVGDTQVVSLIVTYIALVIISRS